MTKAEKTKGVTTALPVASSQRSEVPLRVNPSNAVNPYSVTSLAVVISIARQSVANRRKNRKKLEITESFTSTEAVLDTPQELRQIWKRADSETPQRLTEYHDASRLADSLAQLIRKSKESALEAHAIQSANLLDDLLTDDK